MGMKYMVNSLLAWRDASGGVSIERILWMEEEWMYVINVEKNDAPYIRNTINVEEALSTGDAVIRNNDPFIVVLREEDIPQSHREKRDKVWELIKEMVEEEPQIFQSIYRRKVIRKAANTYNVSELSLFGYLKRYWKRGKTPNALIPDYANCGGAGKEKASGSAKRGRPRKYQDITGEGINVTEDIKRIFRIAINKFYYTTAKNSLVLTYELMRKEYFSEGFKEENGVRIPIIKSQAEVPSFGQFRYYFEKERNIKKEISSRYSNKKYQKQFRAITGNAKDGVFQPGIFEIDCQVGDVYLVSSFNKNWVIGRPAIYSVVDKFSSLVCGVYIGLESGSYAGAMMALLNAFTNKVEYCKQYGIEIEEKEWPVQHLPETIIADRGELEGGSIENLINMLNIKVQNTPPYRADLKSTVERFFGLNNDRIKPFLPGVVDLDGRERGDKDYRLNSKLTLYEFNKVIIKCILYHNNHYNLDYYRREEMMIEDDVPPIPIHLWNWGIANRGGTLRSASEEVVKLALMPSDSAVITAKGIKYKDMYYASASMLKGQVFANARSRGTSKVKISYDPRQMDYIYMHGDAPTQFEKCFLIESNSRYKDKALEEIEYLLAVEKMQKEKHRDTIAQAKIQLIAEIQDIVKNAEDECRQEINGDESDRERIKNIRENRRIEKTANRTKEVFKLVDEKEILESGNASYQEPVDEESTALQLLLKKQKEGLNNG